LFICIGVGVESIVGLINELWRMINHEHQWACVYLIDGNGLFLELGDLFDVF
jgi:hypothetical protein